MSQSVWWVVVLRLEKSSLWLVFYPLSLFSKVHVGITELLLLFVQYQM